MLSWLAHSTPKRVLRVRILAGNIVLCSWARHFTLTVPFSNQVYKWVLPNLMLGVTLRWTSIPSRGEYKYSQSLHAKETGISSGLVGHLARMQTLPTFYHPIIIMYSPLLFGFTSHTLLYLLKNIKIKYIHVPSL